MGNIVRFVWIIHGKLTVRDLKKLNDIMLRPRMIKKKRALIMIFNEINKTFRVMGLIFFNKMIQTTFLNIVNIMSAFITFIELLQ